MSGLQEDFARHGMVRATDDKKIAGVCAGLGQRYGWTAENVRIMFVVVLLIVPGSTAMLYPILWYLMPRAEA